MAYTRILTPTRRYAEPTQGTRYGYATNSGEQTNPTASTAAADNDLYDGNGGTAVGVDLSDEGNDKYIVFSTFIADATAANTTTTRQQRVWVHEGATASTTDGGSSAGASAIAGQEPVNGYAFIQSYVRAGPFSSRDAEWGLQFNNQTANNLYVQAASIAAFQHSIFGNTENEYWFELQPTADFGGNIVDTDDFNTDTDVSTSIASVSGLAPGEWLIFFTHAWGFHDDLGAGNGMSLRSRFLADGVDVLGIQGSGGGSRSSKGYQWRLGQHNADSPRVTGFFVKEMTSGTHTFNYIVNKAESTQQGENAGDWWVYGIHKDRFENFRYKTVATRQEVAGNTNFVVSNFRIENYEVKEAPVFIAFHTTAHLSTTAAMGTQFMLRRDNTDLLPSGTGTPGHVYPSYGNSWDAAPDMSTAADSDNNTIPITIFWVDDPGPGTYTYQILSKRIGTGVGGVTYWNTKDDGTSGFTGTLGVGELRLRTDDL